LFAGWRIAAQAMFAIGYAVLVFSLCLAVGNLIFGCCKQKMFAKETCLIIFGVLIAVASKLVVKFDFSQVNACSLCHLHTPTHKLCNVCLSFNSSNTELLITLKTTTCQYSRLLKLNTMHAYFMFG